MAQGYREPSTSGAVAATVTCSVLGMVVAGPIGAMVGAGLAVAATQPNAQPFPFLQRGRHSIVNVELPRNGVVSQQGVTYFAVDVTDSNGLVWRLLRRYSHFHRFQNLVTNYEIRCMFPGKSLFGCHGVQLDERRLQLENWTRDMLRVYNHTGIPTRLQGEFEDFFTRGRGEVTRAPTMQVPPAPAQITQPMNQGFLIEVPPGVFAGHKLNVKNPMDGSTFVITVPQSAAPGSLLEVSPPAQGAQSSSSGVSVQSPVQQPTSDAGAPQKLLLSISIPPGVSAGQTLGVKVPDGRELTVVVPPGIGQQEVQLEYDAVSGSLDVVTAAPSAPSAPAPSAPPIIAQVPVAPYGAIGAPVAPPGDVFNFQIPFGIFPGQTVKIVVPDGRSLPLKVPSNKFQGDNITLCLDPSRTALLVVG